MKLMHHGVAWQEGSAPRVVIIDFYYAQLSPDADDPARAEDCEALEEMIAYLVCKQ